MTSWPKLGSIWCPSVLSLRMPRRSRWLSKRMPKQVDLHMRWYPPVGFIYVDAGKEEADNKLQGTPYPTIYRILLTKVGLWRLFRFILSLLYMCIYCSPVAMMGICTRCQTVCSQSNAFRKHGVALGWLSSWYKTIFNGKLDAESERSRSSNRSIVIYDNWLVSSSSSTSSARGSWSPGWSSGLVPFKTNAMTWWRQIPKLVPTARRTCRTSTTTKAPRPTSSLAGSEVIQQPEEDTVALDEGCGGPVDVSTVLQVVQQRDNLF